MVNKVEITQSETHLIPIMVNKALNNNIIKIYGNKYKTQDKTLYEIIFILTIYAQP